jgi:hypothetical protein
MRGFKVIPSVTTIARSASSWRDKLAEIEPLGLRSVGLFLTGVREAERRELYRELELAHVRHLFTIPFVHAVSDMADDEYRYLMDRFGTEIFNLHPARQYPLLHALSSEVRDRITIENAFIDKSIDLMDLSGFHGICMDLTHAEDLRRKDVQEFEKLERLVHRVPVRVNHVSLSGEAALIDSYGEVTYHTHTRAEGGDVSYLKRYSPEFFGSIIAIELADSLAEQGHLIPIVEEIVTEKLQPVVKKAA